MSIIIPVGIKIAGGIAAAVGTGLAVKTVVDVKKKNKALQAQLNNHTRIVRPSKAAQNRAYNSMI